MPIIILICVLFAGCSVEAYTPEIKDFSQNASVEAGEFSYTCEISMAENANGMCIVYNGKSANFKYLDMEYEIVSDKIDDTNPAKAVYEAFAVIKEGFPDNASKTADGFRYDGKTALGSFTLLQRDDYSYKSLQFKEANINIEFE